MCPEPPAAGARLLANVTAGAARPFQYRRTVFRLLGTTPATTASLYFSPHAPPAEFRYRTLPRAPDPVVPPPVESGHRAMTSSPSNASSDRIPRAAPSPARRDRGASNAAPVGSDLPALIVEDRERARPRDDARPRRAVESRTRPAGETQQRSSRERDIAVAGATADVQTDAVRPQPSISLTIPGLTERRSLLAVLAARTTPATDSTISATGGATRPAILEAPGPSTERAQNVASPLRAAEPEPGGVSTSQSRSSIPIPRGRHLDVAATYATDSVIGARRITLPDSIAGVLRAARDERREDRRETAQLRSTARPRAIESVEQVRRAVVRRANMDGERLERARDADGTQRAADHRSGEPSAANGRVTAPPRVVTVVAAPPAQRSLTPRAFWSSSVMRCSHLRMLR